MWTGLCRHMQKSIQASQHHIRCSLGHLPKESWDRTYKTQSGLPYYHNSKTGQTVWEALQHLIFPVTLKTTRIVSSLGSISVQDDGIHYKRENDSSALMECPQRKEGWDRVEFIFLPACCHESEIIGSQLKFSFINISIDWGGFILSDFSRLSIRN